MKVVIASHGRGYEGDVIIARPGMRLQGLHLELQERLERLLNDRLEVAFFKDDRLHIDLRKLASLKGKLREILEEADLDVITYVTPCPDPLNDDLIASLLYQLVVPEGEVSVLGSELPMPLRQSVESLALEGMYVLRRVDMLALRMSDPSLKLIEGAVRDGWVVSCVRAEEIPEELYERLEAEFVEARDGWGYLMPKHLREVTALMRLLNVMARVRMNCPWDVKQTSESIRSHLVEEAYEALEAIADEDWEKFKEELGDVLLQVIFHSRIAEDCGRFDFHDVVNALVSKLLERHPHVFGYSGEEAKKVKELRDVLINWESIKRRRQRKLFSSIPRSMPPLFRLYLYFRKLWRLGVTYDMFERALEQLSEESEVAERLLNAMRSCRALMESFSPDELALALVILAMRSGVNLHDVLALRVSNLIDVTDESLPPEPELNLSSLRELLRRVLTSLREV